MNSPGGDDSMKLLQMSTNSCAVGSAISSSLRTNAVSDNEETKEKKNEREKNLFFSFFSFSLSWSLCGWLFFQCFFLFLHSPHNANQKNGSQTQLFFLQQTVSRLLPLTDTQHTTHNSLSLSLSPSPFPSPSFLHSVRRRLQSARVESGVGHERARVGGVLRARVQQATHLGAPGARREGPLPRLRLSPLCRRRHGAARRPQAPRPALHGTTDARWSALAISLSLSLSLSLTLNSSVHALPRNSSSATLGGPDRSSSYLRSSGGASASSVRSPSPVPSLSILRHASHSALNLLVTHSPHSLTPIPSLVVVTSPTTLRSPLTTTNPTLTMLLRHRSSNRSNITTLTLITTSRSKRRSTISTPSPSLTSRSITRRHSTTTSSRPSLSSRSRSTTRSRPTPSTTSTRRRRRSSSSAPRRRRRRPTRTCLRATTTTARPSTRATTIATPPPPRRRRRRAQRPPRRRRTMTIVARPCPRRR
jgi:hypothetical protein